MIRYQGTVTFRIAVDDLTGPAIAALLQEHVDEMRAITPPESKHALNLDSLRQPGITLWSAHDGDHLVGCGALKELDPASAEIKSMRTATAAQRRGVAAALLTHLIAEAGRRGYRRLYLETGAGDFFRPAHTLYQRFGFRPCEPFADYRADPNSVHLVLVLGDRPPASPGQPSIAPDHTTALPGRSQALPGRSPVIPERPPAGRRTA